MTPDEAAAQIAAVVVAGDIGIREAHYPAQAKPPKYPGLVLLLDDAAMTYQSTEQYWEIVVRGLLLTGLFNEQRHHIGEVDPLLAPLVDLFDASNLDGFLLRTAGGDRVDQCQIVSASLGGISYAGLDHYGATILWNVSLRRFAG